MAVEIIWDATKQIACMYCNTSDHAFGPVFSGPSADIEVQEFLDWLKENPPHWSVATTKYARTNPMDPRSYSADELERLVKFWCELPTVEPDGQRYLGGGNVGSTSR